MFRHGGVDRDDGISEIFRVPGGGGVAEQAGRSRSRDLLQRCPKGRSNYRKKHGILFSDAATVLDDQFAITIEDRKHDEQRFVTVGEDLQGRILVVVYSYPDQGDTIRLISARRAETRERKQYEKGR
jgi:uncharacterized DUF497 family protein